MSTISATSSRLNRMPVDSRIRDQIEDLLIDYVHALDDLELERWSEFFTEDAVYQIIPRKNFEQGLPLGILICQGHGMMQDRILALKTANIFEPHTNNHILGKPQIYQSGDGTINVRSNFNVTRTMQDGRMDIYAVGKYLDVIVFDREKPLLKDRRVVLESRCIDILLVYPL